MEEVEQSNSICNLPDVLVAIAVINDSIFFIVYYSIVVVFSLCLFFVFSLPIVYFLYFPSPFFFPFLFFPSHFYFSSSLLCHFTSLENLLVPVSICTRRTKEAGV